MLKGTFVGPKVFISQNKTLSFFYTFISTIIMIIIIIIIIMIIRTKIFSFSAAVLLSSTISVLVFKM